MIRTRLKRKAPLSSKRFILNAECFLAKCTLATEYTEDKKAPNNPTRMARAWALSNLNIKPIPSTTKIPRKTSFLEIGAFLLRGSKMLVKNEVVENVTRLNETVDILADPKKHTQCKPSTQPTRISGKMASLLMEYFLAPR